MNWDKHFWKHKHRVWFFYSSGSFIAGENTFTSLTCKARPLFTSSLLPIIESLCVDSAITQFMSHFAAFVLFNLDENQRLPCFAVNYNSAFWDSQCFPPSDLSIRPDIWSAFVKPLVTSGRFHSCCLAALTLSRLCRRPPARQRPSQALKLLHGRAIFMLEVVQHFQGIPVNLCCNQQIGRNSQAHYRHYFK